MKNFLLCHLQSPPLALACLILVGDLQKIIWVTIGVGRYIDWGCYKAAHITFSFLKPYHSATINKFLKELTGGKSSWVGGYRVDGNGFAWDDGSQWLYTSWGEGEPNNKNEKYVHIWSDGLWNDIDHNHKGKLSNKKQRKE